ncbi:hypothetical protein I4F81_008071 [Pyropia yezoensis]|uniref:Uncharacterized protein n=1 Tax=Pyropia yezoensis TaxID=2788 RepID=A0ACC3C6C6_PYRYE|nr:hypothetical protein I4F81_008071 [Neopyropia yezoensis]
MGDASTRMSHAAAFEARIKARLRDLDMLSEDEDDEVATELRLTQWRLRSVAPASAARARALRAAATAPDVLAAQASRRAARRAADEAQIAYLRHAAATHKNKRMHDMGVDDLLGMDGGGSDPSAATVSAYLGEGSGHDRIAKIVASYIWKRGGEASLENIIDDVRRRVSTLAYDPGAARRAVVACMTFHKRDYSFRKTGHSNYTCGRAEGGSSGR